MTFLPFTASMALALLCQPAFSVPMQDVAALRDQGFYALALERAQVLDDPTERAREVLEVLYHAGDLAGALGTGLAGLEADPLDRLLLWRSARLATDLAAAPLALALTARLAREADRLALDPGTAAETSRWWLDTSAEMVAEAKHLEGVREQQAASEGRALWVVILGLVLLLGVAGWGVQCSGPTQQAERARV
ncbi:MAG TPA: hypothetical protein EYQ74_02965 [Planctomycetes bacterium]|nr:hypothetical protein [Planctomycetota bacterium]HIK61100.1 hypothetical protein [Planctomycetota bacterium]